MELLILGSVLLTGGLLSLAGVFDGDDDKDDDTPPDPQQGTAGDDMLSGDDGILYGLGGDDTLHLSGTAEGHGNQGNDTLTAEDTSTAYGGAGEDELTADGFSTLYGGGGDDVLVSHTADGSPALHGDGGDDTLLGSTAGDLLNGGSGNDLLVITHGIDANPDGITVDTGAGNDTLLLDPLAVFSGGDAGANNPVVVHGFGPDDRLVFGENTAADLDGLNWVQGEDGSFTLHKFSDDSNLATNLTVFTTNGLEPGQYPEFDRQTLGSAEWATVPLDDLRDFAVPDSYYFPIDVVGTNGADVIDESGRDSWKFGEIHGLDGNDTITTGTDVVGAYGGNGDDVMIGSFTELHGDAGNDTLTGYNPLYGGTGDDVLHLERFGGERDDLTGAYGGDGNDTIIAQHASDGGGEIFGGAGDDFMSMANGNTLDAGSGDDTVILDLTSIAIAEYASAAMITLGAGADLMTVNVDGPVSEDFTDTAQVVDFNAAEGDALGIVVAAADQSSIAVTVTQDPGGAYTDLTINHVGSLVTQTLRFQGVTDVDLSQIQLFENEAAVAAGTSYGHL
ncbi:MAG: hypothetical protein U1A24_03830 [Cypionkella sp.]|uniref:calcium-binding protein n=1 Tax=Cypionkella sp. TaxID=2811411 RepID=UPI002ABAADF9|nr:hypothetical protein [Cypionkella sp.]MDZ4309674.1 hypothetical protein [Cypionkella sp.]